MRKHWISRAVVLLLLIFPLVGCERSPEEPQELPTLLPELVATLSPEAQVEQSPTATERPRERATLPPTWTPTETLTPLSPTETPTREPTIQIENPPEACGPFGPDMLLSEEEFRLGHSPTVAWRSVEGASLYRLLVFDEHGFEIYRRILPETSYVIAADVFTSPRPYGWEVEPLDSVGIQMCEGRGGRLMVRP